MRRNTLLPALLGWATVSGYDADPLSHFYPDICPIFSTALTIVTSFLLWLLERRVSLLLVARVSLLANMMTSTCKNAIRASQDSCRKQLAGVHPLLAVQAACDPPCKEESVQRQMTVISSSLICWVMECARVWAACLAFI